MTAHPEADSFRDWLLAQYRPDGRYERVEILTGVDGADVSVRLHVGNRSYYEVRVLLQRQELEAGFATESRMVNEAVEQSILDAGGDLDDLLGDELSDLGEDPFPMHHFFERPAFRFTVRLPLPDPESLNDSALRRRVQAVLRASSILFQESVDEA